MFSRCLLLFAVALICVRCEAAPLSFNGVELGQKWNVFLKAHPKAEVFASVEDDTSLTKAQQLAQASHEKIAQLIEEREKELFPLALYSFDNASLSQAVFMANPHKTKRGFSHLKVALTKMFLALGTPTSQAVTTAVTTSGSGTVRLLMLVWKTPTQSAFARFEWPEEKKLGRNASVLFLVDSPWRSENAKSGMTWPSIVSPTQSDKARQRQLVALLEQLRPHSTKNIEQLKPAPALNLYKLNSKKSAASQAHNSSPTIKPAK